MNNVMTQSSTVTMTSLEIAELTGKRHDNVLADIRTIAAELSLTFEEKSVASNGGRPTKVVSLPKRECLILVSGYSLALRAKIIDRWQELENVVVGQQFHIPTTLSEALLLAGQLAADKEKALLQIAEDKPKVDFANRVACAKNSITVEVMAKLIGKKGLGRNKLYAVLREWGMLQDDRYEKDGVKKTGVKHNVPYQRWVDSGHMELEERAFTQGDDDVFVTYIAKVTGKGQQYITSKLNNDGWCVDENVFNFESVEE